MEAFSYSVSRDLRAPIRHINGFTKILFNKIESPDSLLFSCKSKILTATNKMSAMIDSLLSFSRLGRKKLSFSAFSLEKLINEIIEELKPDTAKREIEWRINRPLPFINGELLKTCCLIQLSILQRMKMQLLKLHQKKKVTKTKFV